MKYIIFTALMPPGPSAYAQRLWEETRRGRNFSFIGGGVQNCVNSVGGDVNFAVIGGGQNNCIGPATDHSSIFSGHNNIVTGSCSSILGGDNNSDGGFPYTGIFGSGIVASVGVAATGAPSNFWVDAIILANIPVDTTIGGTGIYATLPTGALYTNVAAPGFLARPVYVK